MSIDFVCLFFQVMLLPLEQRIDILSDPGYLYTTVSWT
uniref:Uncharacterized protein n=1 Tax=Anguilla anguilla TaxID=7936 RepID=A0A0E9QPN9_ANGAN